jgi:hypothetical protein
MMRSTCFAVGSKQMSDANTKKNSDAANQQTNKPTLAFQATKQSLQQAS